MIQLTSKSNSTISFIVIHHADTPRGREVDAAEIHQWHLQRGFDGIGYNYLVHENGQVESGRPEYWVGAHVKGKNTGTIGVCIVGRGEPVPQQGDALRVLVGLLQERYPYAKVCGHRDLANDTQCPGFDVKEWFDAGQSDTVQAGR